MMNKVDLSAIAEKHATPFYLYDLEGMVENYRNLVSSLPVDFNVHYSIKANPHERILTALLELGACFDASSPHEFFLANKLGASLERISYVGPGKSRDDIESAVTSGIGEIVVESAEEVEIVNQVAKAQSKSQKILLRVHPDWLIDPRGRKIKNRNQFGIEEKQIIPLLERLADSRNVSFCGLHFHAQTQILDYRVILANFRSCLEFTKRCVYYLPDLAKINLGGGFGIPYFDGQQTLDLSGLKVELVQLINDFRQSMPKEFSFHVESGRFITADSGAFIASVLYIKECQGKNYVILDGGLSSHLALTGYGQVFRKNFKLDVLKPETEQMQIYDIFGPSCYSMDILAQGVELAELSPGDRICFYNSGAYGPTFSPSRFLGLKAAGEYFVK